MRSPVAGTPTGALNRGVFVRQLSVGDVVDVYRMRRVVEVAALLGIGPQDYALFPRLVPPGLVELRAAVSAGKAAAERGDWHAVGTANMHFHQAIAGLADYVERAEEQLVQAYADADRAPVTA